LQLEAKNAGAVALRQGFLTKIMQAETAKMRFADFRNTP
jgi:hypothetical protein